MNVSIRQFIDTATHEFCLHGIKIDEEQLTKCFTEVYEQIETAKQVDEVTQKQSTQEELIAGAFMAGVLFTFKDLKNEGVH